MSQDPFGNQVNLPRFEPPTVSPNVFRMVLIGAVLLMALATSWYQVEPDEVGVLLRFGAHVENSPPGLHFKLPFGVDQVQTVDVRRQRTAEFGFRSTRSTKPTSRFQRARNEENSQDEANMLTGDLNAVVVQWVVQYRISDPLAFLFKVRNSEETLRDMSEAVMREVIGDRTVNEVLTVGRSEVARVAQGKLQLLCELYDIGINIDEVVLQDVTPPEPVQPAFNQVNEAEQEKSQLISEAQSEYNKVVPRARGEAQQQILAAEGYRLDRVNRAQGEASRFTALYGEYRKAPEVTRRRIYLETMKEILPKVGNKVIVDDEVRSVLPLLNLDGTTGRTAGRQGGQ